MTRGWRSVALLCIAWAGSAPAKNYLFYGPDYSSGTYEAAEASAPGNTLTVWDATTWVSKTTADFAMFDAIVFGEGGGFTGAAQSNAGVWSAAVTGKIFIVGTDPDFHNKSLFVEEGVELAASGCGTGLYVNLGQNYASS